jgi:hypothetical protein
MYGIKYQINGKTSTLRCSFRSFKEAKDSIENSTVFKRYIKEPQWVLAQPKTIYTPEIWEARAGEVWFAIAGEL